MDVLQSRNQTQPAGYDFEPGKEQDPGLHSFRNGNRAGQGKERPEEDKELKTRFGVANFEKRKHPRFLLNLPIEYHQVQMPSPGTGCTVNASEGGVMAYLPEQMEIGQLLKVRLFFSSSPGMSTVDMLCRVAWTDDFEKSSGYGCGLKFVDFPPEDMLKFRSFLENLSRLSN
jgi:hypothetical protein